MDILLHGGITEECFAPRERSTSWIYIHGEHRQVLDLRNITLPLMCMPAGRVEGLHERLTGAYISFPNHAALTVGPLGE